MACHEMQPNALLIWQNFIIAKSGCYKPTPLKGISPMRFWKLSGITGGNLLWALLHVSTLLHPQCGDSTILYTSWWPYCESLALWYPKSWSAHHCRSNHLIGQALPLAVVLLVLIGTSWAMIHEIHHVRLTAVVVAQVDKLLLLCSQLSWMV
jgi:hypothetical protein